MILFGAGSSVPFGIPGMAGFTEQFVSGNKGISEFLNEIEEAIRQSEKMVGISLPFDLETLLSVLNDLSGTTDEKPISIPTVSLLLKQNLNITKAREKYGNEASSTLEKLREFIFKKCMQPIKKGEEEGTFDFLNRFYGPLMTVLNHNSLENIQSPIEKIFTTNWDICFKKWVDTESFQIKDGTSLDSQSLQVLNVEELDDSLSGIFNYVPLHGSLDLVKIQRPKGGGIFADIHKVPDPLRYFEGKPENMKEVFMIYPLEAIGYEESIKSPYLDMLNAFKSSLRKQGTVFVIGYSLRDPTIGSIFEEIIGERIRKGEINLLSEDLDSRKTEVSKHRLKIVVITPNPKKLAENLRKLNNTNLLQTFIPIKARFPEIADKEFNEKFASILSELIQTLVQIGYMDLNDAKILLAILREKYNIRIPKTMMSTPMFVEFLKSKGLTAADF
jgi:hypothetical protein